MGTLGRLSDACATPALLAVIEREPRQGLTLWSLGGAGWVLCADEATIYVDPFFRGRAVRPGWTCRLPKLFDPGEIRLADALVSTHPHGDHCDETVGEPIAWNTRALFVGPEPCAARARGWGFPESRISPCIVDRPIQAGSARIVPLPAYDPNAESANTYLIDIGGHRVFHSGDSLLFAGLIEIGERYAPDIALISVGTNPPGLTAYMGPDEAVDAAHQLRARTLIPMHWNTWAETFLDPRLVVESARRGAFGGEVVALAPGQCAAWPP